MVRPWQAVNVEVSLLPCVAEATGLSIGGLVIANDRYIVSTNALSGRLHDTSVLTSLWNNGLLQQSSRVLWSGDRKC